MTTFSWPKIASGALIVAALVLSGQGCSILPGRSSSGSSTDGGIFRSDDHGQTWRQKNFIRTANKQTVSLANATVRWFGFDPTSHERLIVGTRDNGLWVSNNAGEQWLPTSIKSGDVSCVAINTNNPTIIYASYGASVMKSTDGGLTWKSVYTESQPGQGVSCVVLNPVQSKTVWASSSGGKLIRSLDEGRTWTLMQTLPAFVPRSMYIDNDPNEKIYIFTRNKGIVVADTVANGWQDMSKALKKFAGGMEINDVRIVAGTPNVWIIATKFGLLQSLDKGTTWTEIKTLVNPGSVAIQNIAINPRQFTEMFLTTTNKLHHTTDGGATWTVTSLPTSRTPVWLNFDPQIVDRLYFSTFKPLKK